MSENNGSPSPAKAGEGRRYLPKAIQHVTVVVVLVLLAAGAYLVFYVRHQQASITGRDLRVLASMSLQVGGSLGSADQLVGLANSILASPDPSLRSLAAAAPFVPLYAHLALSQGASSLWKGWRAGPCGATSIDAQPADTTWQQRQGAPVFCLYRSFAIPATDSQTSTPGFGLASLNWATYLDQAFRQSIDARVFEAAAGAGARSPGAKLHRDE